MPITHGMTLSYKKEDDQDFIKINALISMLPPQVTVDEVDATTHDSEGWKEWEPGLKDGGESAMEVKWSKANNDEINELQAINDTQEKVEWLLTIPTTPVTQVEFNGYLKTFNLASGNGAASELIKYSGTVRVSGKPIWSQVVSPPTP